MAKFERDLVIANDDGKVYRIDQAQLNKLQHVDLSSSTFQLIRGLLAQGVSSAAIPTSGGNTTGPEPDAFCYLVNLSSLKHATVFEGKKPRPKKAAAKKGSAKKAGGAKSAKKK